MTFRHRPAVDVKLLGSPDVYDRVGFVTFPGATQVRVRFRWPGAASWRCDACGRDSFPHCPHCRAIADELKKESR